MICPLLLACGSSVFAELPEQGGEELDGTQDLVDELVQEIVEEVVGAASFYNVCSLACPDKYLRLHCTNVWR